MWRALAVLCALALPLQAQEATETATGAVLRAMDKLNGNVVDIELANREIRDFGPLTIRLTECRYPAGNPAGDAFAGLEITDPARNTVIFQGWMSASSPALNAMEHARYDIWVLRCANT